MFDSIEFDPFSGLRLSKSKYAFTLLPDPSFLDSSSSLPSSMIKSFVIFVFFVLIIIVNYSVKCMILPVVLLFRASAEEISIISNDICN